MFARQFAGHDKLIRYDACLATFEMLPVDQFAAGKQHASAKCAVSGGLVAANIGGALYRVGLRFIKADGFKPGTAVQSAVPFYY